MTTSSKWEDLPTEAIHPDSLSMDTASTEDLVALMLGEDRKVVAAVAKERARIAPARPRHWFRP
jgi:N-acetylmuramic acid 6-phosphate (MurNAc-6-P) etherase